MDHSVAINQAESKGRRKYVADFLIGLALCSSAIFASQSKDGENVTRNLQRRSQTAQLRFSAIPSLIIPNLYYVSIDSRFSTTKMAAWKSWTQQTLAREGGARSMIFLASGSPLSLPWQYFEPLVAAIAVLLFGLFPVLSPIFQKLSITTRNLFKRQQNYEVQIKAVLDQTISHLQARHDEALSEKTDLITQYKLKLRIAADEVRALRTTLDATTRERDGIVVLWENSVQKIKQLQIELSELRANNEVRTSIAKQPPRSEANEVIHNDLKEGMLELMLQTLIKQHRKTEKSMEIES